MAFRLIDILPSDHAQGQFLGRAETADGPVVIAIREGRVFDITDVAASMSGAIARRTFDGGREIGNICEMIEIFSNTEMGKFKVNVSAGKDFGNLQPLKL